MYYSFRSILILLLCLFHASAQGEEQEPTTIYYPRAESDTDPRHAYPIDLLKLAFEKAEVAVKLKANRRLLPQARALLQLESGQNMDVLWTMTSDEREQNHLPIRIPIHKGLIGWRVPFVKEGKDLGGYIESIESVQDLSVLQGADWPDKTILEESGFRVMSTHHYENLFEMMRKDRADLFLRSIVEVWDEAETPQADGLVVEQHLLIRYPTAFYFFVAKNNTALAETIENGLRIAIEDGSFDELFYDYHTPILQRSKLANRTTFVLENHHLPEETPIENEALWYKLESSQFDMSFDLKR